VYLKELHKKWAKRRNVWQKKEAQAQRETPKKKCKEKKERTKVERENVDSLTLGHNGGC
jgi:hypothetical protein